MVKLTKEQKEKKRQEILLSAKEVFSRKSYHQATLVEIAERSSVSKGTLYIYFDSKKDLFMSLIIEEFENWREMIRNVKNKDLTPEKKLRELIRNELNFHLENLDFYAIYMYERGSIRGLSDVIDEHKEVFINQRKETLEIFKMIMEELIEKDFIIDKNPYDLAGLLLGMTHSIIFKSLDRNSEIKPEETIELIYNIFLNGVKKAGE
jgi:AcrR family transcriptional regulator